MRWKPASSAASPYSFLFSPAFNNNRQIAAHVRLGLAGQTGNGQPDQIRVLNADGSSVIIAHDVNSSGAHIRVLTRHGGHLDDGRVAFIANRSPADAACSFQMERPP